MKSTVLEAILDRRSIRNYRREQITGEQLQALISAALASPSAMDRQPWHFTVVQNPEILAQISRASIEEQKKTADEETLQKLNQPDADIYFHAPTVFFISCEPPLLSGAISTAALPLRTLLWPLREWALAA